MKKTFYLTVISLFSLLSCSVENPYSTKEVNKDSESTITHTKASASTDYLDYFVNDDDLEAYVHFLNLQKDHSNGRVIDTKPVEHEGNIVSYIVNFEKGWQIISADKRGPIVLAYSDDNSFSLEEAIPAMLDWLDILANDIEYRWFSAEEYYSNADEEVLNNERLSLNKWRAINADCDLIEENIIHTKSILDLSGHYELIGTYQGATICDSIPHLMNTSWHQNDPYNTYIPFVPGSTVDRCPAGCVTIAVAQVLYYLHGKLGVPTQSPTQGYCYGDANGYNMGFYDYSPSTWSHFSSPYDSSNYLQLFIGDISCRLGTTFGEDGSGALLSDVPSTVLAPYGLGGTYASGFNATIIFNNLKQGLPVLMSAHRMENLFSWPGHAFVIDGYYETKTEVYYEYGWVYDLPSSPGGQLPLLPTPPENYTELHYTSPEPLYFKINWGWGAYYNTGNYSLNGTWTAPGNTTPYMYSQRMIYGFYAL